MQQDEQRLAVLAVEFGIGGEDVVRLGMREFQQVGVDIDLRQPEAGQAGLLRAETSPPPRRRKSSSAMRKPSSVSRMISIRALAVSPSGAL